MGIKHHLRSLLEFESGSNDPTAILLVSLLIMIIQQPVKHLWLYSCWYFISQFGIGILFGYWAGKLASFLINRLRLEHEALYPLFTVASALLVYGLTTLAKGSGFLAVYVMGFIMRSNIIIRKRTIRKFHDTVAWLMQIIMFITLGLLVFPSQLPKIAGEGILISLILMLVARPLSVFCSLALANINFREKLLVSWVGLRGATPIILATFPFVAKVPNAGTIFNLVFFVVITSVLLQGTTIPFVAKLLGLAEPNTQKEHLPIELDENENINNELFEIQVPTGSSILNKQIAELNLPKSTLILLINKGHGHYITPNGTTVIEKHDRLLLLAEKGLKEKIKKLLKN